jgi:two-component system chemotaxis sensor kinase CheA
MKSVNNNGTSKNLSQLTKITKDIQDQVMSMRMVTLKQTFQKMSRLVRDVSQRSGKKVKFNISGEETELDKNVIEEIADPLVHILRNSVDHGIEPEEERIAKGKPKEGSVTLSAFHRGGNIVIEIQDDGKGLQKERILKKAIDKGLVSNQTSMTDNQIYNLIFAPGLSTADKVTNISGRGVGMDVVKKNIEKLRGKVDVMSQEGVGSTFTIKLPLTLAIIDGIVVNVGDTKYIIPTVSVVTGTPA